MFFRAYPKFTMKQRVVTGIIFTMVILAFVIPGYFFPYILTAFLTIVVFMGMRELISCVKTKGITPSSGLSYLGALLSMLPIAVLPFSHSPWVAISVYSLSVLMFSIIGAILVVIVHDNDHAFIDGVSTVSMSVYLSFPIACANIILLYFDKGWYFFVIGLFAPWISDVFAYFTGSLIGKRKIVPHISPKKTWEGCIGGAVFCSALMALFFGLVMHGVLDTSLSVTSTVIFAGVGGLFISVVSQFGDWMASAIKRWAGIKDFSNLLPGHGGILDRFDSTLFSFPVTLVLALIFL